MANKEITKLKPYMAYSRAGGSENGAVLIFAHNSKEAKKIAFEELLWWFLAGRYWLLVTKIGKKNVYKK